MPLIKSGTRPLLAIIRSSTVALPVRYPGAMRGTHVFRFSTKYAYFGSLFPLRIHLVCSGVLGVRLNDSINAYISSLLIVSLFGSPASVIFLHSCKKDSSDQCLSKRLVGSQLLISKAKVSAKQSKIITIFITTK